MENAALGRWPVSTDVQVNWGDMDALGHVNNTVYLRWFESARILYFERMGLGETMNARTVGPIMARQEIDYRRALTYPATVRVETTVTHLGRTSFTMAFRMTSAGQPVAEGKGVMVLVDYRSGEKVPLPESLASAIHAIESNL